MTSDHGRRKENLTKLQSIKDLEGFVGRERDADETFESYERELSVRMRQVESELKEAELQRYDVSERIIVVDGKRYGSCLEQEKKSI